MSYHPGPEDEWMVADSEDEGDLSLDMIRPNRVDVAPTFANPNISPVENFTSLPPPLPVPTAFDNTTISSFTHPPQPQLAAASTISSFPSHPPEAGSSISATSKPSGKRPRPRPIFKSSKTTSDPISDTTLALQTPSSVLLPDPPVIAGAHIFVDEGPGGTIIDEYSLDIAERAKLRSRKASQRSIPVSTDVIELFSEDEYFAPPRPESAPKAKAKAKPKPRIGKKTQVVRPTVEDAPPPASVPDTIPLPSSSLHLPPSDLALSSSSRHSSPPLIVDSSPMASPARKRKRKRAEEPPPLSISIVEDSIDYGDTSRMPPPPAPPVFFADTSATELPVESTRPPEKAKKKGKKAAEEGGSKAKKTKPAKEKGKGKKKTVEVVIESPPDKGKRKAGRTEDEHVEGADAHTTSSSTGAAVALFADLPDSEDELLMLPPSRQKDVAGSSSTRSSRGRTSPSTPVDHDEDGEQAVKIPSKRKATKRAVVQSDEEDEGEKRSTPTSSRSSGSKKGVEKVSIGGKGKAKETEKVSGQRDGGTPRAKKVRIEEPKSPSRSKENVHPTSSEPSHDDEVDTPAPKTTPIAHTTPISNTTPVSTGNSLARRYTIARSKPTPMSELIRRAASHPNSPFASSASPSSASPLAKASKTMLRKIAPLHPNRRPPPPPPPRPPPPKKSKKMLEMEERWEMELEESVEGWYALTDEERKEWRRAKRDKELGVED
ncbi:hypothetical protein FA95DRAFT_1599862 [Auriscalpium vulgare]|uniref:Uncharacterized protein n=1 Tax=Auriscalpium vulgare TaxID=40419 RepID=A0ACB8R5R8_9AGAM|nr:hypothetical protein FA95DRAFT_1599862 [Auriscalpium vulgare]